MSTPTVQPSFGRWLYNHNPFYVLSAALILFAVQLAHASVEIGQINVMLLAGVLVGYTLLLATLGVLIARYGGVWEDARSIFVVVLLLFLGVSVGADELLVTDVNAQRGVLAMAAGYLFAALVSEAVLRLARIRMRAGYRVPYHLLLALFFAAPWWYSPPLNPRDPLDLQWALLQFPVVAGGVFLLLLPAVRQGPDYVCDNGTPWRWPMYPWTIFVVLAVAVGLRSFALTLAFSPAGPMWVTLGNGRQAIAFDTPWGPYFLIPLVLSCLLLLLEGSLATGNRKLVRRSLLLAPGLLLLAQPWSDGPVFRSFLHEVTSTIGAPLWITVWILVGFYGVARLRGVASAGIGLAGSVLLLSVIGRQTIDRHTLMPIEFWPSLLVGLSLLLTGLGRRESFRAAIGLGLVAVALRLGLSHTSLAPFQSILSLHFAGAGVIVLGLIGRDAFARVLRMIGAVQLPLATLVIASGMHSGTPDLLLRVAYVCGLLLLAGAIAYWGREPLFRQAMIGQLAILAYCFVAVGYRSLSLVVGRSSMLAFCWSLAALGIGGLISAHKARWLPGWVRLDRVQAALPTAAVSPPIAPLPPPLDQSNDQPPENG